MPIFGVLVTEYSTHRQDGTASSVEQSMSLDSDPEQLDREAYSSVWRQVYSSQLIAISTSSWSEDVLRITVSVLEDPVDTST